MGTDLGRLRLRCFEKLPTEAGAGRSTGCSTPHTSTSSRTQKTAGPTVTQPRPPRPGDRPRSSQQRAWRGWYRLLAPPAPDSCPGAAKATAGCGTVRTAGLPALWRPGCPSRGLRSWRERGQAAPVPGSPRAALSPADPRTRMTGCCRNAQTRSSATTLLFQRAQPQRHFLTIPAAPNFYKTWQNPALHRRHSPEPAQNCGPFTSPGHPPAAKLQV